MFMNLSICGKCITGGINCSVQKFLIVSKPTVPSVKIQAVDVRLYKC